MKKYTLDIGPLSGGGPDTYSTEWEFIKAYWNLRSILDKLDETGKLINRFVNTPDKNNINKNIIPNIEESVSNLTISVKNAMERIEKDNPEPSHDSTLNK